MSLPLSFLEQTQLTIEFPTSCSCCLSCDDVITSVTPRPLGRLCSWSHLLRCSRGSKRETTKQRHQLISPRSLGKQREGQQFSTCHSKGFELAKREGCLNLLQCVSHSQNPRGTVLTTDLECWRSARCSLLNGFQQPRGRNTTDRKGDEFTDKEDCSQVFRQLTLGSRTS